MTVPFPQISQLLTPLRNAAWLDADRATAYCKIMAVVFTLAACTWIALSRNGLDASGQPLGTDFLSFFAASTITLSGAPGAVYSLDAHYAAQQAVFPGAELGYTAFFYPPTFLLICLPLALLPYFASLAAWLALTGFIYWRVLQSFIPDARWLLTAFVAFPAVIINIGHGQNGFLTAALFGGAVLASQQHRIFAGILFGCLAVKPHLAILIPFALAARGEWRTFLAAGAAAAGLVILSAAALGIDTWQGFLAISPLASRSLEEELVGSEKMLSVFAAVRLLHGSVATAYAIQAAAAAAVLALLVMLARRRANPLSQGAALASGTLLVTPFLLDYDLTLLAIPLVWLFSEARRTGFLPWEKVTILAAFSLPLVSRLVAAGMGIPLGPPVLLAVFLAVLRRGMCEVTQPAAEHGTPMAIGQTRVPQGVV